MILKVIIYMNFKKNHFSIYINFTKMYFINKNIFFVDCVQVNKIQKYIFICIYTFVNTKICVFIVNNF
jgi:hypothetical protein